jgi:hypothetical protein
VEKFKALDNWKPSEKLYYDKYNSKIIIGPLSNYNDIAIEAPHRSKSSFIFNTESKEYDIYTTVYTSDLNLLWGLSQKFNFNSISTPINDHHLDIIDASKKNKILVRKNLWYRKYRYRCVGYIPYWEMNRIAEGLYEEVTEWIDEVFKDSRKSFNYSYGRGFTIYSNDEPSHMLLKIRWGDMFKIEITEINTFDEIKEIT